MRRISVARTATSDLHGWMPPNEDTAATGTLGNSHVIGLRLCRGGRACLAIAEATWVLESSYGATPPPSRHEPLGTFDRALGKVDGAHRLT